MGKLVPQLHASECRSFELASFSKSLDTLKPRLAGTVTMGSFSTKTWPVLGWASDVKCNKYQWAANYLGAQFAPTVDSLSPILAFLCSLVHCKWWTVLEDAVTQNFLWRPYFKKPLPVHQGIGQATFRVKHAQHFQGSTVVNWHRR